MRSLVAFTLLASVLVATSARADSKLSVGPAVVPDVSYALPEVKEALLSNGIHVRLVERHDVPLFSLSAVSTLAVGDAAPGVAELAASSAVNSAYFSRWIRTTKKLNLIGARMSANTDFAGTTVSTHALATHLEQALEDLMEVVRVEFPDADIVRQQREAALDSLKRAESSSAVHAARELLFPASHPYHFAELGTSEAMRSVDQSALRSFWARAFVASNLTLTAAGDIELPRLVKALESTFGSLPKGTAAAPSAPAAPPVEPRNGLVLVPSSGATQAKVAVVALGVPRSHPDYYALYLAVRTLDGMLHDRIREKYGSSYGVDAELEVERGAAPVWVHGSVDNEGAAKALQQIMRAMNDLREGRAFPSSADHDRMMAVQFVARAFETTQGVAGALASAAAVGISAEELRALPTRVRAVTNEDVTRVAKQYLDPAKLRIVVSGDPKVLNPELEKLNLGPVVTYKR